MSTTTTPAPIAVPITSLTYGDRLRSQSDIRADKDAYDELYSSIKDVGQLEPILVDQTFTIVNGGRRFTVCQDLEIESVKISFIDVKDEATATIYEVETNKHRRFNWKQRCLAIDKIHTRYSIDSALAGKAWTNRATADLLGIKGSSNVWYALEVASCLKANDEKVHSCESMNDAVKLLLERKEAEANKRLVALTLPKQTDKVLNMDLSQQKSTFGRPSAPSSPSQSQSNLEPHIPSLAELRGFTPGVGGTGAFFDDDESPVTTTSSTATVIPLSQIILREPNNNALTTFSSLAPNSLDHIISDPPYAIDMEMLSQSNTGMDVSSTADEHDVVDNTRLLKLFLPLAYERLKHGGFCILWTDYSMWQNLCDWGTAAGFKVQRWPLIWVKTSSCLNQAAAYNFTKNHELAIVLRKGNATLLSPQASSVWTGSNDVEAKSLGHPFAKPLALWKWLYSAVAIKGATVCDPFAGRGSSTLAGIQYGIRPIAIECNEDHFNHLVINTQNQYKSLDSNATFC
jgi:DNA modification methylase